MAGALVLSHPDAAAGTKVQILLVLVQKHKNLTYKVSSDCALSLRTASLEFVSVTNPSILEREIISHSFPISFLTLRTLTEICLNFVYVSV